MPKKTPTIISSLTQTGDQLKKKCDEYCNDTSKADKGGNENEIKALVDRGQALVHEIQSLKSKFENLKATDETVKVERFDEKKAEEIKRLTKFMTQTEEALKAIKPESPRTEKKPAAGAKQPVDETDAVPTPPADDVEADYLSKDEKLAKSGELGEDSEEDDDETDEDDEEAEQAVSKAAADKEVDEEEDGEDDDEEEDDEEEEEEATEEEEDEDDDDLEDEETEYETETDEEDDVQVDAEPVSSGTMRQFIAVADFAGEKPDDLPFRQGDVLTITVARSDGWLEAVDKDGKQGMVPSTYLKVHNAYPDVQSPGEDDDQDEDGKTPRTGKMLWKNIKSALKETSVTDVLHAMGALPAGFRESTLGPMSNDDQWTAQCYLAPKLSPSCVSYRDLFYDTDKEKIRSRSVRVQRIVSLVACRQIPLPGAEEDGSKVENIGIEIQSRHVRLCLFDGENVLSNVHTIRVSSVEKDQRTWNFSVKAVEVMKSVEFAEFFIRSNSAQSNIGILFELCMGYIRTKTGQLGEFSCGWVHIPLFDSNGAPIANKTYDEFVHGGTPYEKGVDVDPNVGRSAGGNRFRSLVSGNKQPRLVVKIQPPTKDQKELLDTFPDVLVSGTVYIQYLSFYRQLLADTLLRDCVDIQSAEIVHSPLLTSFLRCIGLPDMMDRLRAAWFERLKKATKAEKKDNASLKELFQKVFMEGVYPLLHSASIPEYNLLSVEAEQARQAEIQRLVKLSGACPYSALLSPDSMHTPFDIAELSLNVLGPHCLARAY